MSVSPTDGFVSKLDDFQVARNMKMGQYKESAGLRKSMSKLDLMNYLDKTIMNPVEDPSPAEAAEREACLGSLADYLLNDSDSLLDDTDEKSILAKVNSLCCLIQKDTGEGILNTNENHYDAFVNPSTVGGSNSKENQRGIFINPSTLVHSQGPVEARDTPSLKPPAGMMRKDSFSDLLLHLPRIASLPKFLNNISEDGENHF